MYICINIYMYFNIYMYIGIPDLCATITPCRLPDVTTIPMSIPLYAAPCLKGQCRLLRMHINTSVFVCLLLFYAIATVFKLYHGGYMMNEMRRRQPKPTLLPTQGIFSLPRHIGMV